MQLLFAFFFCFSGKSPTLSWPRSGLWSWISIQACLYVLYLVENMNVCVNKCVSTIKHAHYLRQVFCALAPLLPRRSSFGSTWPWRPAAVWSLRPRARAKTSGSLTALGRANVLQKHLRFGITYSFINACRWTSTSVTPNYIYLFRSPLILDMNTYWRKKTLFFSGSLIRQQHPWNQKVGLKRFLHHHPGEY